MSTCASAFVVFPRSDGQYCCVLCFCNFCRDIASGRRPSVCVISVPFKLCLFKSELLIPVSVSGLLVQSAKEKGCLKVSFAPVTNSDILVLKNECDA